MDLNGNSKETVYPFCTPTKESSLQQSEATSKESDHVASALSGKGVPETPTANYAKYLEILRRSNSMRLCGLGLLSPPKHGDSQGELSKILQSGSEQSMNTAGIPPQGSGFRTCYSRLDMAVINLRRCMGLGQEEALALLRLILQPRKRPENSQRNSSDDDYIENDPKVLARRAKQIQYGKNLNAYKEYVEKVNKNERQPTEPKTPDVTRKYSRRQWDGAVRKWKINLHIHHDNNFQLEPGTGRFTGGRHSNENDGGRH